MAYNRKNLLLKIIDIQEITLKLKEKGTTQQWIYDNVIREKYHISLGCFNNYLAVNAKKELKELERVQAETN